MKNNKVIYTCLTGNYDDLLPHTAKIEGWDYICFTDQPNKLKSDFWKIKALDSEKGLSTYKQSRLAKILPHRYLSDYEISFYIDANINVRNDRLEKRLAELVNSSCLLALKPHPQRNCIYEEIETCMILSLDKTSILQRQLDFYNSNGFPKNHGLLLNGMIFRRHRHQSVKNANEIWWEIYLKFSKRDQLSFMYALWKTDLKYDLLFNERVSIMDSKGFERRAHLKSITSKSNLFSKALNKVAFVLRKVEK